MYIRNFKKKVAKITITFCFYFVVEPSFHSSYYQYHLNMIPHVRQKDSQWIKDKQLIKYAVYSEIQKSEIQRSVWTYN